MSGNSGKKDSVFGQIFVGVAVAVIGGLLVGGSAPWWWNRVFPEPPTPRATLPATQAPAVPQPIYPTVAPPPADDPIPTNTADSFTGVTGRAAVNWIINGIPHTAIIDTAGSFGVADVTFYSAEFPSSVMVRQDLSLSEIDGAWYYVGSNPRYLPSGVATGTGYAADRFLLTYLPTTNQWTISKVCDTNLRCAEVTTNPLP